MRVISIVGSAALLAGFFQVPVTPPMKMGLWETSSTSQVKITGMDMNMPSRTMTVRACQTQDTWTKSMTQPNGQMDCVKSNESFTANSYSVDISCPKSGAKGHVSMTWNSQDSGSGTMHMDMNAGGRPGTVDTTMTSHFVSSDCGAVKPGSPMVVH